MLATETRAAQLMAPAGSLCSQGGPTCAPPVAPPEQDCARPPLNAQHVLFLHNWQLVLGPKMEQLLSLLGQQEVARNLALAQVGAAPSASLPHPHPCTPSLPRWLWTALGRRTERMCSFSSPLMLRLSQSIVVW